MHGPRIRGSSPKCSETKYASQWRLRRRYANKEQESCQTHFRLRQDVPNTETLQDETQLGKMHVQCQLGKVPRLFGNPQRGRGQPRKDPRLLRCPKANQPKGISETDRNDWCAQHVNIKVLRQMPPIFQCLEEVYGFQWNEECDVALADLKAYLGNPPTISIPGPYEQLYLYLSSSFWAVSTTLVRDDDGVRRLVYYVSKIFVGAE